MLKLTKTMKNVGLGALAVVVLLLVSVTVWNVSAWMNRDTSVDTSRSVREEILPVAKLATYEYNFTQIIHHTSTNNDNWFKIDLPFSDNKFIATIEGVATIAVDAEQMEVDPVFEGDALAKVSIKLPHSQLQQPIALDNGSLQVYEQRDGFFNPVTLDDYNGLLELTQEEQAAKVQESGLLEQSDERLQELITHQVRSIYGEDVQIDFSFIEA